MVGGFEEGVDGVIDDGARERMDVLLARSWGTFLRERDVAAKRNGFDFS